MSFSRISNWIAVGLLAVCFVLAMARVLSRRAKESRTDVTTIRFAHWQLESGLRDAFDVVAREYERLHPDVRIEQMAIPERIYPNWQQTQLVGGTAPDLIELGRQTDELLARYFTPLTQWVDQPNPYNAGTALEGVPWRETFLDGLSTWPSYSESLVDFYGVPLSMVTLRVFYNVDLMKRITGENRPPETYAEFIELCRKAAAYEIAEGEKVLPIAGSQYNAPLMMDALFESQTQKIAVRLDDKGLLQPPPADIAFGYLNGDWSYETTPAIRSGLELMQQTGQYMQSGFLQLGRDDAMFYFAQGKALMIASGSWDSPSIRTQSPFEIGVFRLPAPGRENPVYGPNVLGLRSEAGTGGALAFGLTSQSRHPEKAIDFLRFVTSQPGNQLFSDASGWLQSVVGVIPPEEIRPFIPVTEGFIRGFGPVGGGGSFPDTARVIKNNLHHLVGHGGTIEAFIKAVSGDYGNALKSDLRRQAKNTTRNAEINDTSLAAYWSLAAEEQDSAAYRKFNQLIETQNGQERTIRTLTRKLDELERP